MKYTIVGSVKWDVNEIRFSNTAVLSKHVNEMLEEGWTLYGSPFIDNEGDISQAMIKED